MSFVPSRRRVGLRLLWAIGLLSLGTRAALGGATARTPKGPELREALDAALARLDAKAVEAAVAAINLYLGDQAGMPEVADTYQPIARGGTWLTAAEAAPGFTPWFERIEAMRWWRIGLDPTHLGHALREPAAVALGLLAALRARLQGAERSLALATEACDFLLWAQQRAGTGVFPFPASRGVSIAPPFLAAERQLRRREKSGQLDLAVHQGWAINDDGNGGLQFDNAQAGVAVLDLYEFTHDRKYFDAARKAADWAMSRPLVSNWNYNSFSVHLLARVYRVTGEKRDLDAALQKALLGVIPGQLRQGPQAGRWNDAHNARPAYHYIMLRGLVELIAVTPKGHAARPELVSALGLGLKARNKDFLERGAPNKDKAMETLLMVSRVFASDQEFLRQTMSTEALDALARLVSAQARRGQAPLGASEWGQFLEYVASGPHAKPA